MLLLLHTLASVFLLLLLGLELPLEAVSIACSLVSVNKRLLVIGGRIFSGTHFT